MYVCMYIRVVHFNNDIFKVLHSFLGWQKKIFFKMYVGLKI